MFSTIILGTILSVTLVYGQKVDCPGSTAACADWDYTGQAEWSMAPCGSTQCIGSGTQQSPIEFTVPDDVIDCTVVGALLAIDSEQTSTTGTIENDSGEFVPRFRPIVAGGAPVFQFGNNGLDNGVNWCVETVQFVYPSEHEVNFVLQGMESQIIAYKCPTYSSVAEARASGAADAIGIISTFFEVGTTQSTLLTSILTAVSGDVGGVRDTQCANATIDGTIMDLIPSSLCFYYYAGSFTSPGCETVVKWHLLKTTLTVTQATLDAFASMESGWAGMDFGDGVNREIQPTLAPTTIQCCCNTASPTAAPSITGATPSPVTPAPVTPAPVTPAPVTPAPVTPAPVTPAPVTPAPVTPAPVTPAPVTITVTSDGDDDDDDSNSNSGSEEGLFAAKLEEKSGDLFDSKTDDLSNADVITIQIDNFTMVNMWIMVLVICVVNVGICWFCCKKRQGRNGAHFETNGSLKESV